MRKPFAIGVLLLAGWVGTSCSTGPSGPDGDGDPIDPGPLTLTAGFATYLGGSAEEIVRDVAVDAQGNVYVAGGTKSANFPVTPGAYDRTFNASGSFLSDAFITKLSPNGQVIWSTFLGGPDFDRVYGIEVDAQGFVYVGGRAGVGFPVTPGALQTGFAGSVNPEGSGPTDGFLCKLTPDGGQVVFCTYFGNNDFVLIRDIDIDANGDIFVVTSTLAQDPYPAQWFTNAFQKTVKGDRDVLIAKIKGDGSRVEWATLLGGSSEETNGSSIRVDGTGVYVAIGTRSSDLPTPNGFDHTLDGPWDLYVARLSLDGSQLLYGSYVGGSGSENTETHHLALDPQGNAIAAVLSSSTNARTTTGVYQPASAGQTDILVTKIGTDGRLLAATYLGGSGNEYPEGIDVDPAGNVFLTGGTGSGNFPVIGGQGSGGGNDLIVSVLSPDLSQLRFSRRLGGSGDDGGRGLAVNAVALAVTGQSSSPNWPVFSAPQASPRGGLEGVVTAFSRSQ